MKKQSSAKASSNQAARSLLDNAVKLTKQSRYSDAIERFRSANRQFCQHMNARHFYYYSSSLNKLGKYSESLRIAELALERLEQDKDGGIVRQDILQLMAWNLFETHVRDFHGNPKRVSEFFNAAKQIVQMTIQKNGSPYAKTVLIVADYLDQLPADEAVFQQMIDWLELVNPMQLSSEQPARAIKIGNVQYLSDAQKYYRFLTKAYRGLGRESELQHLVEDANAELRGDWGTVRFRDFG